MKAVDASRGCWHLLEVADGLRDGVNAAVVAHDVRELEVEDAVEACGQVECRGGGLLQPSAQSREHAIGLHNASS